MNGETKPLFHLYGFWSCYAERRHIFLILHVEKKGPWTTSTCCHFSPVQFRSNREPLVSNCTCILLCTPCPKERMTAHAITKRYKNWNMTKHNKQLKSATHTHFAPKGEFRVYTPPKNLPRVPTQKRSRLLSCYFAKRLLLGAICAKHLPHDTSRCGEAVLIYHPVPDRSSEIPLL